MAIGLALLFGINLPENFNSPYKACNIIDFWRRWHMTLSRFMRDYLYIPLGGSKKGELKSLFNLVFTMLLGGLWHGAGWNFILWGGLHGTYLAINHIWRNLTHSWVNIHSFFYSTLAQLITFFCVAVTWVFFRARDLDQATTLLKGMAGLNGFHLPKNWDLRLGPIGNILGDMGIVFSRTDLQMSGQHIMIICLLFCFAWLLPNTQEIMSKFRPLVTSRETSADAQNYFLWKPNYAFGFAVGILATMVLTQLIGLTPSEFLYFDF